GTSAWGRPSSLDETARRVGGRLGRVGSSCPARSAGLVLVEPVVERLQADPEDLGRLLLVPLALLEGGQDEAPLGLPERRADLEVQVRAGALLHAQGQRVEPDLLLGQDVGAVDEVLQLAD